MQKVLFATFLTRQLWENRSRQIVFSLLFLLCATLSSAQEAALRAGGDSDQDGISEVLEQALLTQFAPTFMISRQQCSSLPARFISGVLGPTVQVENGTIYGEVFPVTPIGTSELTAEIHFYHLWREDCGAHGHLLDAEHVSVLVRPSASHLSAAGWKALYWYAAAHQNTVCDVSQITAPQQFMPRSEAPPYDASPHQPDRQRGEPNRPMNGSLSIRSSQWPLAIKMNSSDFPAGALSRLDHLPLTEIAFNAGKHPMQGTIAISGLTADRLASSGNDTANAISVGEQTTSNALKKSYRNTIHVLGGATRRVGKALGLNPETGPPQR